MSRIEAGKLKLDMQQIDLAALVAAGIDSVRPAAEAKHIRLTSAFANVFGNVVGDKDRFQQVFWNLLANAIKFTPKKGRIHTVIKRVDSHVEISVSDTGQGIAPEFLPHIFERFYRADRSRTGATGGSGLGLSIVKAIIQAHGGTIWAESIPGEGTRITFTLPLAIADDQRRSRV